MTVECRASRRARRCVFQERRFHTRAHLAMMNVRPAVIFSLLDDVHFVTATGSIETAWPVLGFKQKVRTRLPIDSLRIPKTIGPNLRTSTLLANERIVVGGRAVVIQPQN